jgi:hypothetical protein
MGRVLENTWRHSQFPCLIGSLVPALLRRYQL